MLTHLSPLAAVLILCFTFLAGAWTYRRFIFEIERFENLTRYRLRLLRTRILQRLDEL